MRFGNESIIAIKDKWHFSILQSYKYAKLVLVIILNLLHLYENERW